MLRRFVPLFVLALTGALTMAAITFLPATLYFPVVEFSTPDRLVIRIFQRAHLDSESCSKSLGTLKGIIRVQCAGCRYVERCEHGLDEERRKIMSRDPIAIPSARTAGATLTMTFSAESSQIALDVCRAVAKGTAAGKPAERMSCFPAGEPR